jgi:hypothetical protein
MADKIFCICQILERKWEYNDAVHKLSIDFKKAMIQLKRKYCTIISLSLKYPGN